MVKPASLPVSPEKAASAADAPFLEDAPCEIPKRREHWPLAGGLVGLKLLSSVVVIFLIGKRPCLFHRWANASA
jgi:hypothetical protein